MMDIMSRFHLHLFATDPRANLPPSPNITKDEERPSLHHPGADDGRAGTAGTGNLGLAGVFRTRDSRRGRVLQAPVVRRCIGVAVHSSAASSPAARLSEDGIQGVAREALLDPARGTCTAVDVLASSPNKSPPVRLATGRAPVRGPEPGFSWGTDSVKLLTRATQRNE